MRSGRKRAVLLLALLVAAALNAALLLHKEPVTDSVDFVVAMSSDQGCDVQMFYWSDKGPDPARSQVLNLPAGVETELRFAQPSDTLRTRLDPGTGEASFTIRSIRYEYKGSVSPLDPGVFLPGAPEAQTSEIGDLVLTGDGLSFNTEGEDPWLSAYTGEIPFAASIAQAKRRGTMIKNILFALILDLGLCGLFLLRKRFASLPRELFESRRLILQLAKNDFRTRFAGSVLGVVWAFVQPVVTVLVYWFVFGMLGSGAVTARTGVSYPFVLWLIAGLVPWFFFQDTMSGGTNALIEYSYLVKKVVFKISILPLVKEVSALFVHLFFIGVMFVLYILSGHYPDLYWLQIPYYSLALFIYSLGVCFATCSIVIFFRDLTQVISIILQVQIWMTPIMWNYDVLGAAMPGWARVILRLNPLFYIATGYRDAMMNKIWFFERFDQTCYFWFITALFFSIGAFIFKRLKVHFADIL